MKLSTLKAIINPIIGDCDIYKGPQWTQMAPAIAESSITIACLNVGDHDEYQVDLHRLSQIAWMFGQMAIAIEDNDFSDEVDDDLLKCYLNDIDWDLVEQHELAEWLKPFKLVWFKSLGDEAWSASDRAILTAMKVEHVAVAKCFLKELLREAAQNS